MNLNSNKVLKNIQKNEIKEQIKHLKQENKRLKKLLFLSVDLNNKDLQDLIISTLEKNDVDIRDLLFSVKLL